MFGQKDNDGSCSNTNDNNAASELEKTLKSTMKRSKKTQHKSMKSAMENTNSREYDSFELLQQHDEAIRESGRETSGQAKLIKSAGQEAARDRALSKNYYADGGGSPTTNSPTERCKSDLEFYDRLAEDLIEGKKDWTQFIEMPDCKESQNVVAKSIWIISFFSWFPFYQIILLAAKY